MAFCKVRPGHYAKARRLERVSFCLMIPALLGVLFASVFHDQFSDFVVASIRSQVVIDSPSSGAYPAFVDSSDPSAGQVVLSFYFFNITNSEDVVNNAAKPKVQEVGPLQYSYNNRKLNTTWDDDADVVRYVEYQYYTPLDSNTEWLQQQTIISLNVLLLAALSPAGGTADFVPVLYPSTKDPMALFTRRTMAEMMWGYTDAILPVPFPGLQHNDTSASYALQQHGVTSIYTGKRSGDKAWEYLEWDGIDSMQCCKAGPAGETGAGTSGGCGEAWGTWDAQAISGVFGNRWHMGLDPSETLYLATYDFGIYRNWPLECRNVGGGPGPGWLSDGSDLTANIGSCDSYTVQDVSVLKFQLPDWILGNSSVSQAEAAGYGMAGESVASVGADGVVAAASSGADLLSSSSSAAMWQQQTHVERKDESSASVQSTTASTSTTLRSASPQSAPVKAASSNVVQQTQKRRQQKQMVQVNQAPAPGSTPSGIMNQTKCEQYAPIFLSLPHFLYGSDVLRYAVDGVSPPDVDKHGSWMGVEPVTGTTLDFQFRIGINAHVTPILTHPLGSPFTYFPFIDDVTKKLNSTCGSGNRSGTSNAGSDDGDNVGSDGVCYGIDGIYWPLAWGELHSTADDYQGNVFKTQVYVGLKVLAALRWGGVVLAVVSVVAALLCRLAAARSHQRFANSEAGKRLIALDAAEGGSGADGGAYDLSNDANGYGGSLNAPLMLSMDDDRAVAGSSSNNNANVNGYRAAAKSDISREDSDPVLRQHRMANILPLTRAAIAEKVPRGIHFSAANCIGPGARPIQGPGWRPACGTEIGGPGYPRSDVSAEKWGPKRDPSETVYGELNENLRLKDVRMPTPRMLYEASSVKFESAASAPQAALLEQMYEQASEAFAAGRDQPDTVLQTDDYNRSHAPNWGTPPFEDQVDDVIYGPLSLKQPEMTVPTPGMEEEASMHGVKPLLGVDAAAAMASEAPVAPVAIGSETFSVLPAAFDSADSSSRVLPVQDSARIGPLTGHQLAADAQAATTASRSAGFGVTGAPTWQSPSASSAAASTTIAEAEAAATIPGVTGETSSTTLTEPNEYRDEFEVGRRNPNALG